MLVLVLTVFLSHAAHAELYPEGQNMLAEAQVRDVGVELSDSASQYQPYIPALRTLAETYVKDKRFEEAVVKYEQIVVINPKDIAAQGRLAELYAWTGHFDKSLVTYRNAMEADPQNLELKTGLARVLRWSQRYDEAEVLYKEVLQNDPNNQEALNGLAKTYAMMGDLSSALNILNNAIDLYPDYADFYKEKGTILAWQKNFREAIEVLQIAANKSPNYAEAYRTMGDVYSWMKSYQHSIDSYKKAITIDPNHIEDHLHLARVYRAMGRDQMAEKAINTALRINPVDAQALHLLQEMRGDSGYHLIERIGDFVHVAAYLFTLVLVFWGYRSKKRVLKRRHGAYYYFSHLVLPLLVVMTSVLYLGKYMFSDWMDTNLIEDVAESFLFFSLGTSFLSLLWIEHRSKEFTETVILAVGAHPDDIELGCGGLLMKAKDSSARIYGLTMTKGERGVNGNGSRGEELEKAAKFMEMDGFWVMDFQDTKLKDSVQSMKDLIEEKIRETRATIVLTHTEIDIHSDHQAVFEATREAARNISILSYEDVSTPREFIPNYYVDISDYVEDKGKVITLHKTQWHKAYMDPEVIRGRAAHRGLQCGVSYAEAFKTYRLIK